MLVYGNVAGVQHDHRREGFVKPVKRCAHCCLEFPRRFLRDGLCPDCRRWLKAKVELHRMKREAANG